MVYWRGGDGESRRRSETRGKGRITKEDDDGEVDSLDERRGRLCDAERDWS